MTILSDILCSLETDFIGRDAHVFDELSSTNLTAREMAEMNAAEGAAVIANSQKSGKGRGKRKWFSPAGRNIYTSLILRPPIRPETASQLTLMAAVALKETIAQFAGRFAGPDITIKWPNDILISERKCAGILTEMKSRADKVEYVILGMGINVNMTREDMPGEITDIATSMLIATGNEFSRGSVIACLYLNIEKWYKMYLKDGFEPVRKSWTLASGITGRRIRAIASHGEDAAGDCPGRPHEDGVAVGIDKDGALLLRNESGNIVKVIAGDIVLSL